MCESASGWINLSETILNNCYFLQNILPNFFEKCALDYPYNPSSTSWPGLAVAIETSQQVCHVTTIDFCSVLGNIPESMEKWSLWNLHDPGTQSGYSWQDNVCDLLTIQHWVGGTNVMGIMINKNSSNKS